MGLLSWTVLLACMLLVAVAAVEADTQPPPRPGGFNPIAPDDPHLQPAVSFAAVTVNRRCNCLYCQVPVAVVHPMAKVESGILYNFTLLLQESDKCLNSQCQTNVSTTDCPPYSKVKPYPCDMSVFAQPLLITPPYVTKMMTCHSPPPTV